MILGIPEPDLDPLVRGMDPDIEYALCCISFSTLRTSVPDTDPNPDPDPLDPHVFWHPGSGSGSTSQRYGSGSRSFYHQAKKVRKTLIPAVL